jgi:uncharacterized protein (DUF58 family)
MLPDAGAEARERLRPWLRRRFRALQRRSPLGPDGMARIRAREIYILPTGTGLVYGGVLFATLIGSLNYQNNLGLLFTFFFASVGLVAMHHCWFNLLGLAVQPRGGAPVFAGDPAAFEVTLSNDRGGARYDLSMHSGGARSGAVVVAARDQQAVGVAVQTDRRGLLPVEEVRLETRYPMGLFRAWCSAQSDLALLVYPRPAASAPEPGGAGGDLKQISSTGREGNDDFLGSRTYRAGDSPRQLDWKAWARERGLVTKEFTGSEGGEIWIDWWRLPPQDPEVRIRLLTRQVVDAGAAGLRFGLRIPGQEIAPGQGEAHEHRCLATLALFDHA